MGQVIIPQEVLKAWEKAVIAYSSRARGLDDALKFHRANLQTLWKSYTQERSQLGKLRLTDARWVGPYLLGFHLTNYARTKALIERAFARGLTLPGGQGPVRIMDLGCGTAASAQALGSAVQALDPKAALEVELMDRSRHLVECGESILKATQVRVRSVAKPIDHTVARKIHSQWLARPGYRLNILALGYVWNELRLNAKARGYLADVLGKWAKSRTPTWLVILEPAAELSARGAMELRGFLVDAGWKVAYPCPSSGACPMGSRGRDWCYSEFTWDKPLILEKIERALGVSRHVMGASAYVFTNAAANTQIKRQSVVVGHPAGTQPATLVCTGDRLERVAQYSELRGNPAK